MNDAIVIALNSSYEHSILVKGLVIFGAEILPYLLVLLIGGWVFFSKNRKKSIPQGVMILFAALVAAAAAGMFKYWLDVPRPFMVLKGVQGLIQNDPYGSFPSQHVTVFAALAFAMYKRNAMLSGVLFAGVFIIGLSRIAAGVHFPSDVIGGFFLGVGIAYAISFLEEKYEETYSLKRKLLFWKR